MGTVFRTGRVIARASCSGTSGVVVFLLRNVVAMVYVAAAVAAVVMSLVAAESLRFCVGSRRQHHLGCWWDICHRRLVLRTLHCILIPVGARRGTTTLLGVV